MVDTSECRFLTNSQSPSGRKSLYHSLDEAISSFKACQRSIAPSRRNPDERVAATRCSHDYSRHAKALAAGRMQGWHQLAHAPLRFQGLLLLASLLDCPLHLIAGISTLAFCYICLLLATCLLSQYLAPLAEVFQRTLLSNIPSHAAARTQLYFTPLSPTTLWN